MTEATAADYAWFNDHWLGEAFCITLVRGLGEAEVLQLFYAAADRLGKDKDFLTKTDKVLGGYPLLRGDRLEKTIQQAFQIDAETQRFVREWVGKKYRVKLD